MPPINPVNILAVWRANAMPQLVIADVDQVIPRIDAFADADLILDLEGVAKLASELNVGVGKSSSSSNQRWSLLESSERLDLDQEQLAQRAFGASHAIDDRPRRA